MEITLTTPTAKVTIEHKSIKVALSQAQEWLDEEQPEKATVQIIEHKKYLDFIEKDNLLKAVFSPTEMTLAELLKRISRKRFSPAIFEA